MGRARVVAPPPEDFVPVPLELTGHAEQPVVEDVTIEVVLEEPASVWIEGDMRDESEIAVDEPSPEELEKERIAKEQHEAILRKKEEERIKTEEEAKRIIKLEKDKQRIANLATKKTTKEKEKSAKLFEDLQQVISENRELENTITELWTKIETLEKRPAPVSQEQTGNTELLKQLDALTSENAKLTREKEAAEKARDQQIVAMRQKATETRGNVQQLNLVKNRKPKLWDRIKTFVKTKLRERRIKEATVGIKNYDIAIIQRARTAVPKILDDMENIHEQLSILEELIQKHVELDKAKGR